MKMAGTQTAQVDTQLGSAVHQSAALSATGQLERLFSRLFRGLVYAQIWEDPIADMEALNIREGEDIVCIGSGGCNVMSYLTARPGSITAVDLSPAHVALIRLKLAAARHLPRYLTFFDMFGRGDRIANVEAYDRYIAPYLDPETRAYWETRTLRGRRISLLSRGLYRQGVLGRFLRLVQMLARILGVKLEDALRAATPEAQKRVFDRQIAPVFDHPLVRLLARRRAALFGLGIPPAQHDKLAADGDGDVIPVLRERARKLFCDFPVSENYFLWQACTCRYGGGALPPYLQRGAFDTLKETAERATVVNRSITDMLADRPAGSVDCAVLLDAQDWMTDAQLNELWAELTRTARPGARVLFRTGGAPDILPGRVTKGTLGRWRYDGPASRRAFRNDRSAIYGGVHLYRFEG